MLLLGYSHGWSKQGQGDRFFEDFAEDEAVKRSASLAVFFSMLMINLGQALPGLCGRMKIANLKPFQSTLLSAIYLVNPC